MKTKSMKKLGILTIAILMFAGSNIYAQRGRNYQNQDKGIRQNQICQMIPDLTEDQQTKIEALRLVHLKEMTAYRNQMNELRAKKRTLMTSDNTNSNEVNSVIDQMTNLQNQKMKSSVKHQKNVRNLLTDEQKVIFDSRPMRGHGYGMGNRNGRGNGSGNGIGRGLNPNCPYK